MNNDELEKGFEDVFVWLCVGEKSSIAHGPITCLPQALNGFPLCTGHLSREFILSSHHLNVYRSSNGIRYSRHGALVEVKLCSIDLFLNSFASSAQDDSSEQPAIDLPRPNPAA